MARQRSDPSALTLTASASRSPWGRCHDNRAPVPPLPSAVMLDTAAGTERTRPRQHQALHPLPRPGLFYLSAPQWSRCSAGRRPPLPW